MGVSRGLGLDGAQVHTPFPSYAEGYQSGFSIYHGCPLMEGAQIRL